MRTIAIIFLTLLIIAGCKKDKYGQLVHKMKFTSSKESKHKGSTKDIYYTQFGDYITSITPSSFIGDFDMVRMYGTTDIQNPPPVFMTLILSTSMQDKIRFADFSNNAEITLNPSLCGPFVNCNSDGTGGCFKEDVVFKLLQVCLINIQQVATLPVQYNGVNLSQFNSQYGGHQYFSDSVKKGNTLTVDMYPLTGKINDTSQFYIRPMTFYFGMTNNTALYTTGPSIQFPSSLNENLSMQIPFVWSNKFNEWTLKSPKKGETITTNSTIGFDNSNLIQIYAGADNIPYTSDDIIVYAPNFWERIYVNVTTN